jgi:A118 family predicted phage portal protein
VPLPAGGAWPPPELRCVVDKLAVWSAWYCGEPDQLAAVYGGQTGHDPSGTGFFASQTGGFKATVGRAVQRWFWGQRPPQGERRTKLHVPLASDIAATSADLLFSEPPSITVDDPATQVRLDELVDDGVHATLLEAAEIDAALGGVYLRVCWDRELADRPWLSAVHPDAAVPQWRWGRLVAVTFWRVLATSGETVVRHLERHEPGAILHGVYEGDADTLGRRVPLTEYPDTAALAEALTDGDTIATGITDLTAEYVPNMRPNRVWRSTPAGAYLGRADIQGSEPLLDALDETYTSWMRDIRLAKGRLIVPSVYLQSQGRGRGATFDADQELFTGLEMLPQQGAATPITISQFAIRVAEHEATARALVAQVLRAAGYATQTFGETGDVAVTATEVTARERRSYVTRDRKIVYWRPGLRRVLQVLLAIDATVFGSGVDPERPVLEFGDGVSEDPKSVAQTLQLLTAAEAASTEVKVRMLHPDWDEDQIAAEVAAIRADQGTPADPAGALGALAGNDPAAMPPRG